MNILMIYPNSMGHSKVPLGIMYILTILHNAGHRVKLFDMTFYGVDLNKHNHNIRGKTLNFRLVDLEPYGVTYLRASMDDVKHDLAHCINEFNPDIIGVSITEDTSSVGIELCEFAKENKSSVLTVAGGVFCMTMPQWVIASKGIDAVCIGEGEYTLLEIIKRLELNKRYDDIPGLWLKKHEGGIIKNEVSPPTDLNQLPFPNLSLIDDRHLYAPFAGHVYKTMYVEGQRGCPRRCAYCCNQLYLDAYKKYFKLYLRKKTIPRLIDELMYLKSTFELNFFLFTDDDFLLKTTDELVEFNDAYKKHINLPFWIQAEANNVTAKKIALLRDSGCISISIGIETGSSWILKNVLKRHTTREATLSAFKIMHQYGIRTSANILLGVPHEGKKEIFETIELARECEPVSLNVNIFSPFHGTTLRTYCVEKGYITDDLIRDRKISWQAILKMPQISQEETNGLFRTFVLYVMLPKKYWPEIEKCEKPSPEADAIFEKLEKIFWEIAEARGIDVTVPNVDYKAFLAKRQKELSLAQI